MSPSAAYHLYLYSHLPKEPNVGIWYLNQQKSEELASSQPVRLEVDLVEWVARPPIGGGGPTTLQVGPYRYTTDDREEIIATNVGSAREWFLIPGNHPNTFLIADNSEHRLVWTAGKAGEPIKFAGFEAGNPNQVFKFVPLKDRE